MKYNHKTSQNQNFTSLVWHSLLHFHLLSHMAVHHHQHRSPNGAACLSVICRQPSFPGCCTLCVEQSA